MQNKQQEIDPSIYQYDQIYEEIKKPAGNQQVKKQKEIPQKNRSRSRSRQRESGSKYISKMKSALQKRVKDHQRAYNKKLLRQNDRLGVGDDQVFVTESFLKKKQEERQLLRKQKQQEQQNKKEGVASKDILSYRRKMLQQQAKAKK